MRTDETIGRTKPGQELGTRAVWGGVGYAGKEFAPARGTYKLHGNGAAAYLTRIDSGLRPDDPVGLANLIPLVAAALYEVGFAWEAGALSTWRN